MQVSTSSSNSDQVLIRMLGKLKDASSCRELTWETSCAKASRHTCIALISTARTERLGILFDRSEIPVQGAGDNAYSHGNPQGVKFG